MSSGASYAPPGVAEGYGTLGGYGATAQPDYGFETPPGGYPVDTGVGAYGVELNPLLSALLARMRGAA